MEDEEESWYPLDLVVQLLKERTWDWLTAPETKYLTIHVDTRDMHCWVKDREGNLIANNATELRAFFDKHEQSELNMRRQAIRDAAKEKK